MKLVGFFGKLGRWLKARWIWCHILCASMKEISKAEFHHALAWDITDKEQLYNEVMTDRFIKKLEDEMVMLMEKKYHWSEEDFNKAIKWG